ncbi:MAG: SlyX family protein [Rhodospirillales bacterium]|jgi:SlyX protein|nr:SlyX family protein [Rhodospirillales bacterium]MBT4005753.1 SlyX family protein [Rhodospirillales bacterium]MBT5076693.1 SlyX family protein [Rhodospirillales bacterium]MBT5113408.1 SlyX family protein [Rhodospirillales bacterium]MBT5672234.1 SlyX family protein [Rhodospirillales bacterium]
MTKDSEMESRLIDLEQRLAHFEQMAEDLSTMVIEQGKTITNLQTQLAGVNMSLQDALSELGETETEEKPPPHY